MNPVSAVIGIKIISLVGRGIAIPCVKIPSDDAGSGAVEVPAAVGIGDDRRYHRRDRRALPETALIAWLRTVPFITGPTKITASNASVDFFPGVPADVREVGFPSRWVKTEPIGVANTITPDPGANRIGSVVKRIVTRSSSIAVYAKNLSSHTIEILGAQSIGIN